MNKIADNLELCNKVVHKYLEAQSSLVEVMNKLCELPEGDYDKAIEELEEIKKFLKSK